MWIFTTGGFVSAVQSKTDSTVLVIRARDRYSLDCLADGVELLGESPRPAIEVGKGTDYPYRTEVSREAFLAWLNHEVENYLSYTNFKDAAKASLGEPWSKTLSKVWTDSHGFTDAEGEPFSPYLYWTTGRGERPTREEWDDEEDPSAR